MYNIVFESERLYFVNISEKLINDYLVMVNDEGVQKGISHKVKHYTYEQEMEWLNSKIENKSIIFSMIEKETNEFVGNIEIMKVVNGVGEIGISLTPLKQDKHYGQESILAFIDYCHGKLNILNFDLGVFKTNSRAIRCYEKIGFVKDSEEDSEIHMNFVRKQKKL